MLPLSVSLAFSEDEDLQGRIRIAFNVIAHEVILEDPDTENHITRVSHANTTLQWKPDTTLKFVDSVLSSPAIQNSNTTDPASITDEQILEGVRQIWNSLIGIVS